MLSALTVYAVNEDNEAGLAVGSVGGEVTEAGGTTTFAVALRTQPSAAVTVTVTGRDGSEGTVSPPSLTFVPSTWNTAQTVTVTGKDDDTDDGTVTWQVRLDPSSGDADYGGLADTDVSVTTTDDDGAPGVELSLNPTSVSEDGGTATVSAVLSHPSGEPTTVTVTAVAGAYTAGSDATIVIAAGTTANATDTATVAAVNNTTGRAGPHADGYGDGRQRPGDGGRDDHGGDGSGVDPDRRRRGADGGAVAEPDVGLGDERGCDGDCGALEPVERAVDGDGGGGIGPLHGGHGRDHHHCGRARPRPPRTRCW